jgi:hypothetical protein
VLGQLHNDFLDERRTPPGIVAVKDGDCLRLCDTRIAEEERIPMLPSGAGIFPCRSEPFNYSWSDRECSHDKNDQMAIAEICILPDGSQR